MDSKSKGVFKNLPVVFLLLFVIIAVCVPLEVARAGGLFTFDIFGSLVEFLTDAMNDDDNKLFGVIYYLMYQLLNVCLLAVTTLVYFGAWLIDVFLDEAIYSRVLNMNNTASAVSIGWTTVRDTCNTFFILFLLVIAFATILRVQAYNAKSLLPKLIISLFLINFSATIAMMVIDFGQVFMFEIKSWMGTFSGSGAATAGAGSSLTSIVDYFNTEYNYGSPTDSYTIGDVVGVAFAVAYSAILGLLYIMLALFLMVRIIVFVILVIISPFAFFSIILPGMRTYTSQWWQSLVSHAIFGPVFLFFIFLSTKMAQEMQTFTPIPAGDDISSLSYIIAELIPHIVAIGMLMAAIPVTQKLGVAGASKFIGGAAGIGKIGIGAIAGAKLAGGGAKKVGGGTVGRAHSALKGRSEKYGKATEKVSGAIKSLPIVGRISIEHESKEAEKKKEAIAKHEKVLESRTDKDKKKYVDSFKLDKNKQAEARQAMLNLMTKDSGRGLTDAGIMDMGYEKDTGLKRDKLDKKGNVMTNKKTGEVIQEPIMKADKEKFMKDFGQTVAHDMDTTNTVTARPDLIKDKEDKLDRVRKTVANGEEKKIKLDALLDDDIDEELQELLTKRKYKILIDSKSQEEKDGLAKGKEDKLIRRMQIHDINPRDKEALDITDDDDKKELLEQQTEIAYLTGTKNKAEKMKKIKGLNSDQSLNYDGDKVDPEVASSVVNRMDSDDFVEQDPELLKDVAYMIEDTNQFSRINKNKSVTAEQTEAIKKSIGGRIDILKKKSSKTAEEKKEYERLETAANIMGCSITKADKKKDKDKDDYDPSYGFATSKPQPKQSTSGNKSGSDQETVRKLKEMAREKGFEGIDVSEKNQGISVGSAGFARTSDSGSSEGKTGRVSFNPKIVENTKELFETDKKYEKGMADLVEHEKQHGEKFALEIAKESEKRIEEELKEYSKKEGVTAEDVENKKVKLEKHYYEGPGHTEQTKKLEERDLKEYKKKNKGASAEDIENKKAELHEKYVDHRGIEMQTQLQQIIASGSTGDDFVEDQARMHVTADAVHEGLDKMGEIEYGPENPGLHLTHSRFIKQGVLDKITERMEEMRQDLVAKHEARKGGESDETNVEGGDEFMTDSEKSNTETKEPAEKGKARKAVDSYTGYAKKAKVDLSPENVNEKVIRPATKKMNKKSIPIAEAEIKALELARLYPPTRTVSTLAIPPLKKGVEIAKRKDADPDLTNKQILEEEAGKLKGGVKKVVSANASGGVEAVGNEVEGALNEAAKNATGGKKVALEAASVIAGNKHVRRAVIKKAERLASQDEEPAIRKATTKESKTIKPKEERHQQVFDKMNDINLRVLDSIQEKNKGGDSREGLKRLDGLKGSLSELVNESQEVINGKDGGDLPIIAQSVEGGIETARGILQKRIEEQEKGSSGEVSDGKIETGKPIIRKPGEVRTSKMVPRKLPRQELYDEISAISDQSLRSIGDGKNPKEEFNKLNTLSNSLAILNLDNKEAVHNKDDEDLSNIYKVAKDGIWRNRIVLRKRIEEQEKGSSGEVSDGKIETGKPIIRKPGEVRTSKMVPRKLPRQELYDEISNISNQSLRSIGDGKDPKEEIMKLNTLSNSLAILNLDNKETIHNKGDEDLSNIYKVAKDGIWRNRIVLRKRIEEQEKGSSDSDSKQVKPKETPKQSVKPDVKPKVSVEDLEMKDIKEEYDTRKEINKAQIGTKQIEIAQSLGLKGRGVDNRIVHSELAKNKYARRMVLDDKMDDINYKIAGAKKSGGSGAKEVKKLFAEKKKMAKEFVEETNPDLMRDIRYEEGMLEKMRGANKKGMGRRLQAKRRGNLDKLQKEKQTGIDEVLGGNKGFRERKPVRIKNEAVTKPQSEKIKKGKVIDKQPVPTTPKPSVSSEQEKQAVDKQPVAKSEKPDTKQNVKTAKPSKTKAPKQKATTETTEPETKPVKSKTTATKKETKSAPVVKTKVSSKVDISGDISKQIEESLKNISNDMVQNINVGVDSSQGITGLDLKELVDSEKIAELVKKGVDIKDVEKSLKNVQKSFDKFKGNNGENANTTVFGAGTSAAEIALNKVLLSRVRVTRDRQMTDEYREGETVRLATISNVLSEIKSGMEKQGGVDGKEVK